MKRWAAILTLALLSYAFLWKTDESGEKNAEKPVLEQFEDQGIFALLERFGEPRPAHYLENSTPEMVARGRDLIFKGKTEKPPHGKASKAISKYFDCNACHNFMREDTDLKNIDQDGRLTYAKDNDLPYLQGSTFWGIVNRETWYNDDYVLKYGSLVEPAKNSLQESINLCAEVCSQGRPLEEWEMESILAYFWSLEMKLSDLDINAQDLALLDGLEGEEARTFIKSYYLQKSPATFGKLPESKRQGYPLTGRPEMGKVIYEQGCQHCHRAGGESDLILDDFKSTFKWLKRNIAKNSPLSIYEIIRKGTYAELGHKEYMPHYTEEKMSDQQVEDLRAYIEEMAGR